MHSKSTRSEIPSGTIEADQKQLEGYNRAHRTIKLCHPFKTLVISKRRIRKYEKEPQNYYCYKHRHLYFDEPSTSIEIHKNQHQDKKKQHNPKTTENRFVCKVCDTKFAENEKLISHLFTTQKTSYLLPNRATRHFDVFTCLICGQMLVKEEGIRNHIRIHQHQGKVYYCRDCQIKINDLGSCFHPFSSNSSPLPFEALLAIRKEMINVPFVNSALTVPRCGLCKRALGYYTPLIHQIIGKTFGIDNDLAKLTSSIHRYHCNICDVKMDEMKTVEMHARHHIMRGDLICSRCKNGSNRHHIRKDIVDESKATKAVIKTSSKEIVNSLEPTASEYWYFQEKLTEVSCFSYSPDIESAEYWKSLGKEIVSPESTARCSQVLLESFNIIKKELRNTKEPNTYNSAPNTIRSLREIVRSAKLSFFCKKCDKHLGKVEDLLNILQTSTQTKENTRINFSCQICNFICENILYMEQHIIKDHVETNDLYCEKCLENNGKYQRLPSDSHLN